MTPKNKQKQTVPVQTVHKQILEIKKKIQLSEGQRKAAFEDCENERRTNTEEIQKLKKEVSIYVIQLNEARRATINLISHKKRIETIIGPIDEKTTDDVETLIDLQKTDKTKMLNLLYYKFKERQKYLIKLGEEYQTLLSQKSKKQTSIKVDGPNKKAIRDLQNSIHAVEVQLREANHITVRYKDIRKSLQDDANRFQSNIKQIEEAMKVQNMEIDRLQKVMDEAIKTKSAVRSFLVKEEKAATTTALTRERQTEEGKRLINSRKQELELLEKRIFQSGKTKARREEEELEDAGPVTDDEAPESSSQPEDTLSEAFETLKRATGGTSIEEVLERFSSQKDTHTRLLVLKIRIENEKKELERRLEKMTARLEHFKYSEVKDLEMKSIEMDEKQALINEELERSNHFIAEAANVKNLIAIISPGIKDLHFSINPVATSEEVTVALEKIKSGLKDLLKKLSENQGNIEQKSEAEAELEEPEDRWLPAPYTGLVKKTPVTQQGSSPVPAPPTASEDEEDVPNRAYLKRQAQLVIDAKARRKNIRMLRD